MRMSPEIILAGQQPDFLGTIHRANQAAAAQNDIQRQNALADFYQSNGAAVAQGDQQALNALAGFDPMAAMDVQKQRLGMDATRQNMRINEQELQMRKETNARAAQKWAMTQDAATVQAEAAKMRRGLMMAGQAYQAGDEQAFQRILQENGVQPFPMAEFPYRAAEYEGMLEGLEAAGSFGKPEPYKPLSGPGKVYADIQAGALPEGTELRSPQVIVNTGNEVDTRPIVDKPPKGFQRRWDEQTGTYVDEPIPGSDADVDRASLEQKTAERNRQGRIKMTPTLEGLRLNIAEIEDGGWPVRGAFGELSSYWPASNAADFKSRNEQITTAAALQEIANMRATSPTGGAVGSLTDGERIAIGQAVTGLAGATSNEEYLRAAKLYREVMLDTAYGAGNWEITADGGVVVTGGGNQTPGDVLQVGTIEDGHRFLGGDPANPDSWEAVR